MMEARAVTDDKPFAASREKLELLIDRLGAPDALGLTHSELEQMLKRDGLELIRQLFQITWTCAHRERGSGRSGMRRGVR
jgi:hypothetical protein